MTTFSIITVVYNDVTHIVETMESVINQSYKHIEYILIDGKSNDGTREKIFSFIKSCMNITLHTENSEEIYIEAVHTIYPTLRVKFLSQKDNGIYDAMNKGVRLATQEWINFVNCGDKFSSHDVLKQVSILDTKDHEVIYGDMFVYYVDQQTNLYKRTSRNLEGLYRLFSDFGHPNCFIKTSLHKKTLYDLKYHLSSDYDLIYKFYTNGIKFLFTDIVVSKFKTGGSSDKNGYKSLREALQISIHYNKKKFSVLAKIYIFYIFALLKKTTKLYLPSHVTGFFLKYFYTRNKD